MKKIIKVILIALILTTGYVFTPNNYVNAATAGTINIQGLADRTNLAKARVNRGDNHVREAIPYVVPAGVEVTMKQASGTGVSNLTVQVLNNDRAKEPSYTLNQNGAELKFTVEYESVIFIRVPRGSQNIDIEYSFNGDVIALPYFYEGDDENAFFSYWDSSGSSFAVFENEAIQFLVPIGDKEWLRNLDGNTTFANFDEWLNYYSRMVEQYDYLLGVEDNAENPVHNNPPQQFFAKANASGSGLAYYNSNETAMSSTKFGHRYLSVGWVEKHELGHGYQQSAMMDREDWPEHSESVREVWNNVYAHSYRVMEEWNGDTVYSSKRMSQSDLQYTRYDSYRWANYQNQLNFFAAMFDSFGYEGFRGFNRDYRELTNMQPAQNTEYANTQYMAWFFSKHAGVNFVPHFEKSSITIIEDIEDKPDIRDLSYAEFLNYVVKDDVKRQEVATTLDLLADYQMIDTSLLRDSRFDHLNLKGNVSVTLDIDNLDEIINKTVILKNGEFEIEQEIFSNTIEFTDVPAGIYRVLAPTTESGTYTIDHSKLLTVSEDSEVTSTVTYTAPVVPSIDKLSGMNDVLLNGLGDYNFATLEVFTDRIRVRVKNTQPHAYKKYEYANIKIFNANDEIEFEQSFIGDVTLPANTFNIAATAGYRVEITFDEPGRSSAVNYHTGLDILKGNNKLVIELEESGTYVNGENILPEVVDTYIAKYNGENDTQYYYHSEKVDIMNSINRMEEAQKLEYLEKHKDALQLHRPLFVDVQDVYEYKAVPVTVAKTPEDILADITVSDFEDGDISSKVTVLEHNVDFYKVGEYQMKLRVEDSDLNASYVTINVNITRADVEPITPEVDPLKPEVDPITPEVDPLKPEVDPITPEVDPLKPEVDPITPEVDPLKPEVDPITPEVDPLKPEVDPITPEVDPLKPEVDPITPEVDPITPEVDPIDPSKPEVDPITPEVDANKPEVESKPLPKTGVVNASLLLVLVSAGLVGLRKRVIK